MYDRGNPSQMVNPHQPVDPKTYTDDKVKLPHPDELPGCALEVQNYHQPPVGTFHAKYMVVDRKIAILNSNNIQDRVYLSVFCMHQDEVERYLRPGERRNDAPHR